MVYFTCDKCGESLKKNQVAKHTYNCRSNQFSCIDCQVVFTKESFVEHIKCISEDQKYGGANFGEVKQNLWTNQVNEAINTVEDPKLKKVLVRIKGYTNIPRKEPKFINFLKNSVKIKEGKMCSAAWQAIVCATKRLKEKEETKKKL